MGWAWNFITLREKHRLMIPENRILRRIFEHKKEEVAGGWRRLHKEELHNLYASPNIIRVIISRNMRWVGRVAYMGEVENAHETFIGKP
jgi:hypothetical protein